MLTRSQYFRFGLVASAAIILSACESSGSYRVASIGDVPGGGGTASSSSGGDGTSSSSSGGGGTSSSSSGGSTSSSGGASSGGTGTSSGGGTGSSSSSGGMSSSSGGGGAGGNSAQLPIVGPILVTAGNTVIGVAGKQQTVVTALDGVVTKILYKTGQTLVDVGNGNTLVLGKAGGKIGDLLRIDIGSKTVIGAPNGSPLLGVGVLSPTGSGNILTATVGQTLNATVGITRPLTGTLTGGSTPTGGANGLVGGVVTTVTGVVGGVTGKPAGTPVPQTGAAQPNTGLVGGVLTTVTGVLGGVTKTTPKSTK